MPEKEPKETPPAPPEPKLITPDWGKLIDELTGKVEALSKDKEDLKSKSLNLSQEIETLKKSAPPAVVKQIDKAFEPWKIFFWWE